MESIVYSTPMALHFVPILLSVLLAVVGATLFSIGCGASATQPSRGLLLTGACIALAALPASRMTSASAVVLLVAAGVAVLMAALAVVLSLSVFAYAR